MADVFEKLSANLKELPQEVEDALIRATKKAVNKFGENMEMNLKKNSESEQLNARQYSKIYDGKTSYAYLIDWKDSIVDADLGIRYGIYADKPRRSGKRNFSLAPATWHDLAYIIDEGRVANFSTTGMKVVAGNGFIKKARRNAKKWTAQRDIYAEVELDVIGKKLNEG